MRPPPRPAVLLLVAALAGCLQAGDAPGGGSTTPVPFRTLAHDADSGITEPQRAVLADEDAWAAAWALHAEAPNPKGARPAVDFARERVVVVALGQKGSGCHDVRVEDVTRSGDGVLVHVARYDGDVEGRACAAVLVQPVHFVAIQDRDGDVSFTERVAHPGEAWPPGGEDEPPADAEPLSTRRLARGSFSGVGADVRAVLRSQAAWEELWARHAGDEPAPFVSFPNESVVAVVEHGPTGCFGVHVGNVTHDGAAGVLTVEVVHEATPPEHACIQALQDAYDFVAVPGRPAEPRFVEVEGAPLEESPAGGPDDAAPSAFRTLDAGSSSGIHEPARRVLTAEDEWRAFWAEHAAGRLPAPEPPEVDFAAERVFAAVAGDRPNTCWALRVTRVDAGPENVTVEVATYAPPPGAVCGSAVTQPHHVVALPRDPRPIVVVEATREGPPPNV